ncbi:trigger factor [Patescibacteria group bacterium]
MNVEIKKREKSEIEIIGEISAEKFSECYKKASSKMAKDIKAPGFRPGKVPESIALDKIGEHAILDVAGEMALRDEYPKIIEENKLQVIGPPHITITKIAQGEPLGYKLVTAVVPEIVLPEDFQKLASDIMNKKEESVVTEEEVKQSIDQLIKMKTDKETGKVPELSDEFAKSVGKFNTADELKDTIKKNLQIEKEYKNDEKKKIEALEAILKKIKVEIPDILIDAEKGKMLEGTKENILGMGLKWEDYLTHLKKEEKDILDGFNEEAVKRVKYGLLLSYLEKELKIEVTDEEVESELAKLKARGDGNENLDKEQIKSYIYGVLRNDKIFKSFEDKKENN